ncbi:MAG: PD-(D/E)XK nuclease domain-containing protein, partial [Succinivibrionaceae bacterium]|nr:PD-(D/E)XK nuclease domain-containing protein [Succinivibrionaceae bacterium]
RYLETHIIRLEDYTKDIKVKRNDFLNPTSLLDMKQPVLMCQTGYLTAHSRVPDGGTITLGIPNMEVRRSLASLLSERIFPGVDFTQSDNENFFSEASPEEIVEKLNSLMNTISYENYKSMNEKTVQGLLHAFFIGAAQPVRTEVQSAAGRSDIVLEYENRRVVFELKYAEKEADCESQLQEGVKQMKSRRYGVLLPKKDVLQIALVFNGDKAVRQFTRYEAVE